VARPAAQRGHSPPARRLRRPLINNKGVLGSQPANAWWSTYVLRAHSAHEANRADSCPTSLSQTAAAAVTGETVIAARHLNVPGLMRVGTLALKVRSDAATRAVTGAPSWAQLLEDEAATWTLPEAVAIAVLRI
jgi:hypothetical protein